MQARSMDEWTFYRINGETLKNWNLAKDMKMEKFKSFLARKDVEISVKRYLIDALGAMAQGLFCSLLIGTIINTIGQQAGIEYLTTVGGFCQAMSGPAMAAAIGYALQAPPLVLFW